MSLQVLIDDLVRQSMVMIARLATAGGARAPLAHMRDQIFLDLTEQLRHAGLGHKVIADMFSMSLRAYYTKLKKLEQSQYFRNRTLWQSVVDYMLENRIVDRKDLFQRFRNDDPAVLVGIMSDLVSSGWVYRKGESEHIVYRVLDAEDLKPDHTAQLAGLASLAWINIRRHGPLNLQSLCTHLPGVKSELLEETLASLVEENKVQRRNIDGDVHYSATVFYAAGQDEGSWYGPISHHYGAVMSAICARAEQSATPHFGGGSTFSYVIDDEHPLKDEVLGLFERLRTEASDLRCRTADHNQAQVRTTPSTGARRITIYMGAIEEPEPNT